jgi:VWFA-related protein
MGFQRFIMGKIKKFSFLFLIAGLCFILGPSPQSGSASQEAVLSQKPLQHEVKVTLKLIQVYITDKKGNPVTDLEKADFTVLDNGVEKLITEFEKHFLAAPEIRIEETRLPGSRDAASLLNRTFIILIDYLANDLEGIMKSVKAALEFMQTTVGTGDHVALFTFSTFTGLTLHEYFTTDHKKVRETIKKLRDVPGILGGGGSARELGHEAIGMERLTLELYAPHGGHGGLGQRSFFTALKDWALVFERISGQKNIILFSRGWGRRIENPKDPDGSFMTSAASALASANSPVFTVNTTTGMAKNEGPVTTLEYFSKVTGGKYFDDVNYPARIAEDIRKATSNYYVLGYSIPSTWDGKFHEIEVKVKKTGYQVYAQKGYFNPKPFSKYSNIEKTIHLMDLALSEKPLIQEPVRFSMAAQASSPESDDNLLIAARISADSAAAVAGKKMEVVELVFSSGNEVVALRRTTEDLTRLSGEDAYFLARMGVAPGDYRCRIIIRNLETGAAAIAAASVTLPEKKASGIQLFPPLFLTAQRGPRYLRGQTSMAAIAASLLFELDQFAPELGKTFKANSEIWASLRCAGAGTAGAEIKLSAFLFDRTTGREIPVPLTMERKGPGKDVRAFFVRVQFPDVEPDEYLFFFVAKDLSSGETSAVASDIVIE